MKDKEGNKLLFSLEGKKNRGGIKNKRNIWKNTKLQSPFLTEGTNEENLEVNLKFGIG